MLNSTEHKILTAHKTKIPTNEVSCFKSLRCCMLINVKMPTIVELSMESFINSGPGLQSLQHDD